MKTKMTTIKIADEIAKRYYQSIKDRLDQIEVLTSIASEELLDQLARFNL